MTLRLILAFLAVAVVTGAPAQEEKESKESRAAADDYMRDELGVNDITAPPISQIFKQLDVFKPVPFALIAANPHDATYDNRLQTALHFGSLVADGFVMTIAERTQDVQDIGKALIRESRSLGVGDRLAKRSKSLFDLSDKADWQGMREELIRTQADVEKSMLDMRDEQMAHMVSLGGWLRGFQIASNSCNDSYTPEKAAILGQTDIMDYYQDRLDTLNPRLKKTEYVTALIAKLQELRFIADEAKGEAPSKEEVKRMRDVANQLETITLTPVDAEGHFLTKPATP